MRPYILFVSLFLILSACKEKQPQSQTSSLPHPSEFFPQKQAKVLVVGTFHFDYPGLDAMKTDEKDKVDVLEEPKKGEVQELVGYLEQFRPNKIAIEARPSWEATRKLREYKAGSHRNERDERYQVAMRLADRLSLDTLYAVDAGAISSELLERDSAYVAELAKDYDFRSDSVYDSLFTNWFEADQKMLGEVPLLDYFKHVNSRAYHQYGYGAYLVGDFKLGEYRGADLLAIYWYDRNLRILRNLQRMTESGDDRILLLIGNGHAAVLRHLLESSPEYEFVELGSLSGDSQPDPNTSL